MRIAKIMRNAKEDGTDTKTSMIPAIVKLA